MEAAAGRSSLPGRPQRCRFTTAVAAAFSSTLLFSVVQESGAEVNLYTTSARMLISECPDLLGQSEDVNELWHMISRTLLETHSTVYIDPVAALRNTLKVLETFLMSYPPSILHMCPGTLMRWFKKAGDLAIAAHDPLRSRILMQWGTTYRIMALSRWWIRITSNPEWTREKLPPEALTFDAEYQGAYDLALQTMQNAYGVTPRPIDNFVGSGKLLVSDPSQVLVLAVCLYKEGNPLTAIAAKNHRLYSAAQGYQYHLFSEVPEGGWDRLGDLPKEPHYWKIQQTLTELEREDGPEWVLVIDCDAFFTNASTDVLDIAAAYNADGMFYVAEDPAGINTGVLLFRRHDWTRAFLRRVLKTPFVQIWDQSQYFWQLLREFEVFEEGPVKESAEIVRIHQSQFNAYHSGTADSWNAYGWKPGDFVVHYAGCPWDEDPCWQKMELSAKVIEEQVG